MSNPSLDMVIERNPDGTWTALLDHGDIVLGATWYELYWRVRSALRHHR